MADAGDGVKLFRRNGQIEQRLAILAIDEGNRAVVFTVQNENGGGDPADARDRRKLIQPQEAHWQPEVGCRGDVGGTCCRRSAISSALP